MDQLPPQGWYEDPTARHALRFWSGSSWTEYVAKGNWRGTDPLVVPRPSVQQRVSAALNDGADPQTLLAEVKQGPLGEASGATASASMPAAEASKPAKKETPQTSSRPSTPANEASLPSLDELLAKLRRERQQFVDKEQLDPSADPAPRTKGWYPNPDVAGGTRYSDGTRWTGDARPPRRKFAAPYSREIEWPNAIILLGFLCVPSIFCIPLGWHIGWVLLLLPAGLIAFIVWILRGQGPSTAKVEARLAEEKRQIRLKRAAADRAYRQTQQRRQEAEAQRDRENEAATMAQIMAISNPETARSLQNLQHLLYTHVITDAEFQAAKDRLFGISASAQASKIVQIEELEELYRRGLIGDLEFAEARDEILDP